MLTPIASAISNLTSKAGLPDPLDVLRSIMAALCKVIYRLVTVLYDLFINVSRVEFLTQDDIKPIYERITMILAIIMLFYVTFEAIKYVIEPDNLVDKEKGVGNVVKRIVVVIMLIAFVPNIFDYAYRLQNRILNSSIFSTVILGAPNTDPNQLGRNFSTNIFGMFYKVDEDYWGEEAEELDCDGVPCQLIVNTNLSNLSEHGKLTFLNYGLNAKTQGSVTIGQGTNAIQPDEYNIEFHGLLAVIVGGFMVYILAMYCIDAGRRVVQLGFLQLIAPIPIIGYLAPKKDGIFQKWMKQCIVTYLDLFLRMAIIYFILFLCELLGNAYYNGTLFNNLDNLGTGMKIAVYIAISVGLLYFAHKAPDMLKELFPSSSAASGSLGLRSEDRKNAIRGAGRVVGGAIGGTVGFVAGTASVARGGGFRGISGMVSGIKQGSAKDGNMFTNIGKANRDLNSKIERDIGVRHDGGSIFKSRFMPVHEQNRAARYDRRTNDLDAVTKGKDGTYSTADEVKEVKQAKAHWESLKAGGASEADIEAARKEYKRRQKAVLMGDIQTDSSGKRFVMHKGTRVNIDAEDEMRLEGAREQAIKLKKDMKGNGIDDITITLDDGSKKRISQLSEKEFIDNLGAIATAADEASKAFNRQPNVTEAKVDAKAAGGNK